MGMDMDCCCCWTDCRVHMGMDMDCCCCCEKVSLLLDSTLPSCCCCYGTLPRVAALDPACSPSSSGKRLKGEYMRT